MRDRPAEGKDGSPAEETIQVTEEMVKARVCNYIAGQLRFFDSSDDLAGEFAKKLFYGLLTNGMKLSEDKDA